MKRSKSWWGVKKFGKLRLRDIRDVSTRSTKKDCFVCECGKSVELRIVDVSSGKVQDCGMCYLMDAEHWASKKFGKLRMKSPGYVRSDSSQMKVWMCDCGRQTSFSVHGVTSGKFKSCGKCRASKKPETETRNTGTVAEEIAEMLRKNFAIASATAVVGPHSFSGDVIVPNSKTIVEIRSGKASSWSDEKTEDVRAYGFEVVTVTEREWRKDRKSVEETVMRTVKSRIGVAVRDKSRSELMTAVEELDDVLALDLDDGLRKEIASRRSRLLKRAAVAQEDIVSAAISSHNVMCQVKNMAPNEAFGNDPFVYYGLGLVGEAGELSGALLRAIRNGGSHDDKRDAVAGELADCLIYSVILGHSTGIDLMKIVNEKARIVETRARAGYYGPPIR